jgi:peptidoglycan/LPS O-acetylase OafA/YrhL
VDPVKRRKRPGRLWLFFWGRKRRGFPGLLVAIVVVLVVLAGIFGLPGGADLSRLWILVSVTALLLLILASIALVVLSALGIVKPRPRGRR